MNKMFCFIILFLISLPISLYIESFEKDDIVRYLWILAIIIQHACIFILYLINRASVQKIMRTTIVIGDVVICFLIYVFFVCVIAAAGDKGMIYSIKSIATEPDILIQWFDIKIRVLLLMKNMIICLLFNYIINVYTSFVKRIIKQ